MLVGVGNRMSAAQITDLIQKGKGSMPGQPDLNGADLAALLAFLGVSTKQNPSAPNDAATGTPEYHLHWIPKVHRP